MCGIAGAMSRFISANEQDVFEDLLSMATLRGKIGAGVILVSNKKGAVQTFKTKDNAVGLLTDSRYIGLQTDQRSVMIGHARAPTKGTNTLKDIHPHRRDHIVGVHNGTLYRVADKTVGDESDSGLFFEDIAKRGIEAAVEDASGAFAIVYVDVKEGTLNFLRNDQRPLWFGASSKASPYTLYWGSEQNFVITAMLRHGLTKPEVWSLPPDELHTYKTQPTGALIPVVKEVKKKAVNFSQGGGSSYSYKRYGWVGGKWKVADTGQDMSVDPKKLPAVIQQKSEPYRHRPAGTPESYSVTRQYHDKNADLLPKQVMPPDDGSADVGESETKVARTYWPIHNRKSKKSARKDKKAKKLAKRNGRDGHNAGHVSYLETLPNFFVSPSEVKQILEKKKCAYCTSPEDFTSYQVDQSIVRWVDRDEFLCSECKDDPVVRNNLIDYYPKGWPEFEVGVKAKETFFNDSLDDLPPKSTDDRLLDALHAAHKFH